MKVDIEVLQALFLSNEFKAKTPLLAAEKVYRVGIGGGRHYQRGSNGRVYKSLTTFIDAVVPKSKHLTSWRDNMAEQLGSVELADEYVTMTADYGTLLHIAVADFIRDGNVNWHHKKLWFQAQLSELGLKDRALNAATNELTKDLASMVQFFYDYSVEVIAVELPVFIGMGVATLIDLVVIMDDKASDQTPIKTANRHKAIINLKSGKKGFFDTHVLQLEGERMAFNETYSKLVGYEIDCVYNLAPTNWRVTPKYKIKNQTEAANKISRLFGLYLDIANELGVLSMPATKYAILGGVTEIGGNPSDNVKFMGFDELSNENIKISQNENKAQD
jgi:hypothetical protein